MAKKTSQSPAVIPPTITRADLASAVSGGSPETLLTESALQNLVAGSGGKVQIFAGLNILKPKVGETHGPFRLVDIAKGGFVPKPTKKNKNPEAIDKYFGENLRNLGRRVSMPLADSFVGKCEDAKLAVGDLYAVKRTSDYTNSQGNSGCKGYELFVLARVGTPEAEKIAKEFA